MSTGRLKKVLADTEKLKSDASDTNKPDQDEILYHHKNNTKKKKKDHSAKRTAAEAPEKAAVTIIAPTPEIADKTPTTDTAKASDLKHKEGLVKKSSKKKIDPTHKILNVEPSAPVKTKRMEREEKLAKTRAEITELARTEAITSAEKSELLEQLDKLPALYKERPRDAQKIQQAHETIKNKIALIHVRQTAKKMTGVITEIVEPLEEDPVTLSTKSAALAQQESPFKKPDDRSCFSRFIGCLFPCFSKTEEGTAAEKKPLLQP